MLDIETLGREPGAAVISIAAVTFDAEGIYDNFETTISIASCIEAGLSVEGETLEWWLDQPEEAREQLSGGEELTAALTQLCVWLRSVEADEIWANSPKFDCAMLEAAGEAVGVEMPWAYYDLRDFRTLRKVVGVEAPASDGVEHDALDDATHQAAHAIRLLEAIDT